jgi:hypothetical protein
LQVRRIVDIDSDSGQIQHDARLSGGLSGSVMRFEAVVPEAKRE